MRRKWIKGFTLGVVLTMLTSITAYAAGPGEEENPIPEGVSQEQWNRLNDQTIEFDELSDLITYFNPNMKNTSDTINNSIGDLEYTKERMQNQIRDLQIEADNLKDSDAINTIEGMELYKGLIKAVKDTKNDAYNAGRQLEYMNRSDSSLKSNLVFAAKNYTYFANQIMIGYQNAIANQAMIEKMVELSNAGYEAQKLSQGLGLATEADVLSAQKDLLSANGARLKINSTVDNLRQSLCLMTGYSEDAVPTIGDLPNIDAEILEAIDLEADTKKAIGNNYDLISLRHSGSDHTSTGMKYRDSSVSEAEQNITITMQSYYQTLMQAKSSYDASCTAFEKARLEMEKAERSKSELISNIQYLQAQMAYLQARGEKESAYNTMFQAYDTYQWGIKGIIVSENQ